MTRVDSHLSHSTTSAEPSRPPFQFRLRSLMLASAACSVGFATMVYIGPLWALTLGFLLLMIVAHIAANAIGTSLRSQAPRPAPAGRSTQRVSIPTTAAPHFHHRTRLGRSIVALTLAGAACGVLVGRIVFLQIDHGRFSTGDWLLGLGSFAVIAGLLGFMASCFFRIGCRRS